MAKLKISYEFGMVGSLIVLVLALLQIGISSFTKYVKIFGTFPASGAIEAIIFAVIALLGTEISRRDRKIGYTAMIVISIAGIITFVNLELIGFAIVLIGGFFVLLNK